MKKIARVLVTIFLLIGILFVAFILFKYPNDKTKILETSNKCTLYPFDKSTVADVQIGTKYIVYLTEGKAGFGGDYGYWCHQSYILTYDIENNKIYYFETEKNSKSENKVSSHIGSVGSIKVVRNSVLIIDFIDQAYRLFVYYPESNELIFMGTTYKDVVYDDERIYWLDNKGVYPSSESLVEIFNVGDKSKEISIRFDNSSGKINLKASKNNSLFYSLNNKLYIRNDKGYTNLIDNFDDEESQFIGVHNNNIFWIETELKGELGVLQKIIKYSLMDNKKEVIKEEFKNSGPNNFIFEKIYKNNIYFLVSEKGKVPYYSFNNFCLWSINVDTLKENEIMCNLSRFYDFDGETIFYQKSNKIEMDKILM
ncbi:MAG: hypothetical protein WC867_08240 [Candidatus Pacearchaeota archaeon]|jgi:hypothetical protein